MLTLYLAPGSSSMAPHIALHEIGVPFDTHVVSFTRKETRSPTFLNLNPDGKVPVLLIDGRPLTEVAAILFYLARRFPQANLLQDGDIEIEAQALSWMSFIASTIHPARALGLERGGKVFAVADQRLGSRDWALGSYSVVDIHLFRLYWRFANSLHPPLGSFPNLTAHHDRMMMRPAVQRTIAIETAMGYELPS
ncbi:MAG TPA: glutathione S-transferase family protein [Acetobacteraceae bacterium]|nr:glutathione S-transferase family protein [Acetobacteraceae bacterium]